MGCESVDADAISCIVLTGLVPASESPPLIAFEKNGLKIVMNLRKAAEPWTIVFTATFHNQLDTPMISFVLEAAVPDYLVLTMHPATSRELEPHSKSVTQSLVVQHTSAGDRPVQMKLWIVYQVNG